MGRLDGKVAIVTGAGSGIGRATAMLMAREGAKVVCADVSGAQDQTVEEIRAGGGEAKAVQVDVRSAAEVQAMIDSAVSHYGQLDVLFNNAGIEGEVAPTADCTEANFDRVISVNLKGIFLCMKFGISAMVERGGSIINTASIAGVVGFPTFPAYCAAKGGVIQLTKAAALEYALNNVRVNAICPGVIWTPMNERLFGENEEARKTAGALEPMGRVGEPGEVAAMVLFLASDESSFVTGGVLPVDGGFVAQ